jgi:hypothetical protein
LQNLLKRKQGGKLKVMVNLKGVGISIIDEQPREILFFVLNNIDI